MLQIEKFEESLLFKTLKRRESEFIPNLLNVFREVSTRLSNRIPVVFPNYTLHDINHCLRVISYMGEITDIDNLNDFEIALLLYSALLHDIGMAVDDTTIKNIEDEKFELSSIKHSILMQRYNNNSTLATQEIIRRCHADLSAEFILRDYRRYLTFQELDSIDFANDLALICKSHTKNTTWLTKNLSPTYEKSKYEYNLIFSSIMLRIADILDIDGQRAPKSLYQLLELQGISDEEWKQHFVIHNIDKIKVDRQTMQKKIVFMGECSDVRIHRKILTYFEWINNELKFAIEATSRMAEKYKLYLKDKLEDNIKPVGYSISNYKLTVDFLAITNLLMGEKIYDNKIAGLRELVQNSIDACRVRFEIEQKTLLVGEDCYQPKIKIIFNKSDNIVIVKDNGIGMTEDILLKYFLSVGKSYYRSDDYTLYGYNYKPIGNFGIGFLACFMLSDKVEVITRHYKHNLKYTLELQKNSEYLSFTSSEDISFVGTEIHLKYSGVLEVLENEKITVQNFLTRSFITDEIQLEYINISTNENIQILNSIKPSKPLGKNEYYIDLKNYTSGIEGYVKIKNKNFFISNSDQIIDSSESILYFENNILEKVEAVDLSRIYNNGIISFLYLPIYSSRKATDFEKAVEILDDVDEAIEKIDPDEEYYLFLPKELHNEINVFESEEDYFEIVPNLRIEQILDLDYPSGICPKAFLKKVYLLANDESDLFLSYERDLDNDWRDKTECSLFIRNINILHYRFTKKNIANNIAIPEFKINVLDESTIPNISRNNLIAKDQDEINYAIMRAVHLGALATFPLPVKEKKLLIKFIKEFYSKENKFTTKLSFD